MTGTGSHMPKPEVTSPEVTCFGMGNRGPVGKRDRGRRVGQNRGGTRAQSPKSNLGIGGGP